MHKKYYCSCFTNSKKSYEKQRKCFNMTHFLAQEKEQCKVTKITFSFFFQFFSLNLKCKVLGSY